jgi:hypothetical protein
MRNQGQLHDDYDDLFCYANQLVKYGDELARIGARWGEKLKVLYALHCEEVLCPRQESDSEG